MSERPQPSPTASASRWDEGLPYRLGYTGQGVSDLQQRLARLDYAIDDDEAGEYGEATARAVRTFQRNRGLRVDGICGRHTWSSVVEAGFGLGDRLLYLRAPMLHGDDVAELQRGLSALGFDPGAVDGIFGERTATALADFQHNIGISSDGICGPRTLAELSQLKLRRGAEDLVSSLRERLEVGKTAERSRRESTGAGVAARGGGRGGVSTAVLQDRVIAVGEPGGFQVGAVALSRALVAVGAHAGTTHHPDESEQAEAANAAAADCYIGLRLEPELTGVRTVYYRGYRYESETSKHLAELISRAVAEALDVPDKGSEGMALPVLRETRMPAVIVELGSPAVIAMYTSRLATAILGALVDWFSKDWT